MNNNYLVTGGAGFIGYHLCSYLLSKKKNVICIDNLNDYYSVKIKKDRIKNLKKFKNFKFFKIDICDNKNLFKKISKYKINKIIHLAAQAGVRHAFQNPTSYFNSNLRGFFNIIEFARVKKISELLCASTSSVYGNQKKFPIKENYETSEPIQFYAATKKANEVMAYSYHKMFKINFIFMRFFTVYGPWGRPDMSIFKFVKNIKLGKKIDVYNFGNHLRDFTYIDDIISAINKLLIKKNTGFKIFNIGNSKMVKLMNVIKQLEILLNKKARIKYLPLQPGDIRQTYSSTKLLRKYCKFKSTTSINKGLKKFVDWFNEYYK